MLVAESFRVSRMREICTSGLRRGEAVVTIWYTGIEAHTGKP